MKSKTEEKNPVLCISLSDTEQMLINLYAPKMKWKEKETKEEGKRVA